MKQRALICLVSVALSGIVLSQASVYDQWGTGGDEFATSIASLGDVDGDGFDDFAIGAPHGAGLQPDAGYVVIQSAATGNTLVRLDGVSSGDLFGQSLAGLGDIDGDGAGDVVVGVPGRAGADVFSGATGTLLWSISNSTQTRTGWSVAAPGDVNGNGVADFAVGAPEGGGFAAPPGHVVIYDGGTGAALGFYVGETNGDLFGWSLDATGDVNGDFVGDLVVGAPGVDLQGPVVTLINAGKAYLISGAVSQLVLHAQEGSTGGAKLGFAVAGGGDVNGDGTPDFAFAEPYASFPGLSSGRVTVISGAGFHPTLYEINGVASGDELGTSIDLLEDVDGDGKSDILIGAPGTDVNALVDAGRAHVFSGDTGLELYHANGVLDNDRMGDSVAEGGHVNADAHTDVFTGAAHANHGLFGSHAGRVRLTLGSSPTMTWYCAAKVNSAGCTPAMTFNSGTTSQSVGDNLLVYAVNVLIGKPGMLLWSYSETALPFYGGTLCVMPPIRRTPVQVSFANNPGDICGGAYSFHFSHAYMASESVPVGATVHFQYWSRDTGFAPPNSIGLTNGMRAPIYP